MGFTVTSQREDSVSVTGLGVIPPGETAISDQAAEMFKHQRGLALDQVALPEGVTVTKAGAKTTEAKPTAEPKPEASKTTEQKGE